MNILKIIVNTNTGEPRDVVLVCVENEEIRILDADPLTNDEILVDVGTFNDHVKPVYVDALKDFKESATPDEIAVARPTLPPKHITEEEKAADLLKVIALNIMNNDELLKAFGIEPRPTDPA